MAKRSVTRATRRSSEKKEPLHSFNKEGDSETKRPLSRSPDDRPESLERLLKALRQPRTRIDYAYEKKRVIQGYSRCIGDIREAQTELYRLVSAIAPCNNTAMIVDGKDPSPVLKELQGHIARENERWELHQVPSPSPLTAELVARSSCAELRRRLEQDLESRCEHLAKAFLTALDKARDEKRVGTVVFQGTAESVCELVFHTRVFSEENTEETTQVRTSKAKRKRKGKREVEERTITTAKTRSGEIHVHRVRHHHLMMQCRKTYLPLPAGQPLPAPVRHLVDDAVPAWLRPHVYLLKGDLILERTASQVERVRRYSHTATQETTIEEEVFVPDPAIVLDLGTPFVLAAWTGGEERVDTTPRWQSALNTFASLFSN